MIKIDLTHSLKIEKRPSLCKQTRSKYPGSLKTGLGIYLTTSLKSWFHIEQIHDD